MKKLTKEQIDEIIEKIIDDFFFPSDTAINITRVKFIKVLNTALESLGEEECLNCKAKLIKSYNGYCAQCIDGLNKP